MIDQPISQFMSHEVLQGDAQTPLREVVTLMRSRKQSAFVVTEEGRPTGVITERDVVTALASVLGGADLSRALAGDVMNSPVHTLRESSTMGEVVRVVKERDFRRVPIVDDKGRLSGIVNLQDLQAAMNAALERRGRDLEVAVMERTRDLQAANAKLEELAIRDGLTGLLNRRAMADKLTELHALARRYGNRYAVLLLDIDHFKPYNDTEGHLRGDDVIRTIAELLRGSVREADSCFRYGGEEFLVTMPETDEEGALRVARRIQDRLLERAIPHPTSPVAPTVTLSIGISEERDPIAEGSSSWEAVVECADRALYRAKENGRNRIVSARDLD